MVPNYKCLGNGKGTLLYFHHLKLNLSLLFACSNSGCVKIITRLARILLKKRKNTRFEASDSFQLNSFFSIFKLCVSTVIP